MSIVKRFQEVKDKKALLRELANSHRSDWAALIRHLVETKDEASLEFLLIDLGITRGRGHTNILLTVELIELIKASNNIKLFSAIPPDCAHVRDQRATKLCYEWFVETKNELIFKRLFAINGAVKHLKSKTLEVANYAIEWKDSRLLKLCCLLLPITVPALKLMIEKAPIQLELMLVNWLVDSHAYCEIDIIDCLIADYKGENKPDLMAGLCVLSHYSVDVVRRVAENFPEALHYIKDWSVQSDSQEVYDLFMFNILGHKLSPSFLIKKNPKYLEDYQKEIRLVEFVRQLYGVSLGHRYSDHFQKYDSQTRLKLCKMANVRISIGDLILCLRDYIKESTEEADYEAFPREDDSGDDDPIGNFDVFEGGPDEEPESFLELDRFDAPTKKVTIAKSEQMALAFINYMDAQTDEYRQSFRESLAAFRDMSPGARPFPDWVNI